MFSGIIYFILHPYSSGSFPPALSKKEEAELIKKQENGDIAAKNKLIEHNLRLVAHIAKKYSGPNIDQDDLISIGTIGLIKAISSFKSEKNIKLATYASRCIENAILPKSKKINLFLCGKPKALWALQKQKMLLPQKQNLFLGGLPPPCNLIYLPKKQPPFIF